MPLTTAAANSAVVLIQVKSEGFDIVTGSGNSSDAAQGAVYQCLTWLQEHHLQELVPP